jgi:molybdopterin-guanine dinucleotide biosynthesis protein A
VNTTPDICGLVLAGGFSTRMGYDKGLLNLHGTSQRSFLFEELRSVCRHVYTSCRLDQSIEKELNPIHDALSASGPLGGLLAAFLHRSDCAWLTVAVDMPNVNAVVLRELTANRDPQKVATCFLNPETKMPEPLLTLWEPKAFSLVAICMSEGRTSPRQILCSHDVNVVTVKEESILCNVNDPVEVDEWCRRHG